MDLPCCKQYQCNVYTFLPVTTKPYPRDQDGRARLVLVSSNIRGSGLGPAQVSPAVPLAFCIDGEAVLLCPGQINSNSEFKSVTCRYPGGNAYTASASGLNISICPFQQGIAHQTCDCLRNFTAYHQCEVEYMKFTHHINLQLLISTVTSTPVLELACACMYQFCSCQQHYFCESFYTSAHS